MCRLCNNKSKIDEPHNNGKVHVKKHLYLAFENNFKILNQINNNQTIIPCNCLISIHFKCLLRLLIISQNLKCNICGAFIVVKSGEEYGIINKIFSSKYIMNLLTLALLICFNMVILVLTINSPFSDKFFHFKIIVAVFCALFKIVLIYLLCREVYTIYKIKIAKQIIIDDRSNYAEGVNNLNLESQANINGYNQIPVNVNSIKITTAELEKSAITFRNFFTSYSHVSKNDIIQYKNEKLLRKDIYSKHELKVSEIFKRVDDKHKELKNKTNSIHKKMKENFSSIHKRSYLQIIEKNPTLKNYLSEEFFENIDGDNKSSNNSNITKKKTIKITNNTPCLNKLINKYNPSVASNENLIILNSSGVIHDNNLNSNSPVEILKRGSSDNDYKVQINSSNLDGDKQNTKENNTNTDNQPTNNDPRLILHLTSDINDQIKKEEFDLKYILGLSRIAELDSLNYGSRSHDDDVSPHSNKKRSYYLKNVHTSSGNLEKNVQLIQRDSLKNSSKFKLTNIYQLEEVFSPMENKLREKRLTLTLSDHSPNKIFNDKVSNSNSPKEHKNNKLILKSSSQTHESINLEHDDYNYKEKRSSKNNNVIDFNINNELLISPILYSRNNPSLTPSHTSQLNFDETNSTPSGNKQQTLIYKSISPSKSKFLNTIIIDNNQGEALFKRNEKKMKSNRLQSADKLKGLLLQPKLNLKEEKTMLQRSSLPDLHKNTAKRAHEIINNIKKYKITNLVINTGGANEASITVPYNEDGEKLLLNTNLGASTSTNVNSGANSVNNSKMKTLNVNVNILKQ